MLYSLITFPMLLLAFCVQEFVPRLGCGMNHALFMLFPTWYFCSAVTVPYPVMIAQAFLFGLAWDLRWIAVASERGAADLAVGTSAALLALFGSVMQGVRPLYLKGRLIFPALLAVVCVFLLRGTEYLVLNFKRGGLQMPRALLREMLGVGVLSLIAAPIFLMALHSLARSLRYDGRLERA